MMFIQILVTSSFSYTAITKIVVELGSSNMTKYAVAGSNPAREGGRSAEQKASEKRETGKRICWKHYGEGVFLYSSGGRGITGAPCASPR